MADGLATVACANALLNTLVGTSFSVSSLYIENHTAATGAAGTTGGSTGSTVRPRLYMAAAVTGTITMSSTAPSWTNTGVTETITDQAVWSSSSGGTFYWSVQLTLSKAWASGDTLTQNTCQLALSPLAA